MKIFKFPAVILFVTQLISCVCLGGNSSNLTQPSTTFAERPVWFPTTDIGKLKDAPGLHFIRGLRGFQQTTEYTCGPAVLMSLAKFYKIPGILENAETEMRIAKEVGTRSFAVQKTGGKPGTTPQEMVKWLENHGFETKLTFEEKDDESALKALKENIKKGIPTLVEWIVLGGHWAIVVGYDDRGTGHAADDTIIFADPYDRYDGNKDGYTFFNAEAFDSMWFDALYFDKLTWRTMITAVPKSK